VNYKNGWNADVNPAAPAKMLSREAGIDAEVSENYQMAIPVPKYWEVEKVTIHVPKSNEIITKSARVSPCGKYRYTLTREWQPLMRYLNDIKLLTFILLNPSTADHKVDDPTIRRCVAFARRDGYNAIRVVNLFAYRCSAPEDLCRADDPIGPENDDYLSAACKEATDIVVGWGSSFRARSRLARMENLLEGHTPVCFGVNADGSPKHPLYVPGNTKFVPYKFSRLPRSGRQSFHSEENGIAANLET
jgi:hypothetical protein